jgi:ABC-type dipeptide/oligopeptide/nickel transport system ATPase component
LDFSQKRRSQAGIRSLGELRRKGKVKRGSDPDLFVHGTPEFDCLVHKWSRKEVLGVIGDSGVGKSEVVLQIMKDILISNPESCGVYVSLEMTDQEIAKRWFDMTGDDEDLADRLFILSRYDEDGKSREGISMRWIKENLNIYKDAIGDVSVFTIDHLHVIGENDPSTLNSIMVQTKEMAVNLNALGIPMAQVNKSAGGKGEIPLDADSVLACSQFKYIANNIIQIHRPILRLEEDAKLSVLGWGYAKVREAHKNDKVKRGQNKLLAYDRDLRMLRKMTTEEYTVFKLYYNTLLEMKSAEERNKAFSYDLTKEVKGKDGKVVQIKEIFSGDKAED